MDRNGRNRPGIHQDSRNGPGIHKEWWGSVKLCNIKAKTLEGAVLESLVTPHQMPNAKN
jgi:hypothetical protein